MNEIHKLYKKNYAKLTKTEKRIAGHRTGRGRNNIKKS